MFSFFNKIDREGIKHGTKRKSNCFQRSRQGGGAGLKNRGAGETKLELDRRKIEEKISALNKELELIEARSSLLHWKLPLI